MPQNFEPTYRLGRRQIEDENERLISVLDALDGNPDCEEFEDLEPCCEDEGTPCDDEGAVDCRAAI